jgi:hypothetical protein
MKYNNNAVRKAIYISHVIDENRFDLRKLDENTFASYGYRPKDMDLRVEKRQPLRVPLAVNRAK